VSAPTPVPLRLGPLQARGYAIRRSGIRWLREDGHPCIAGEVIAYCNLGLTRMGGPRDTPIPFAEETRDLQMALVTPVSGRLRRAADSSRGGFLDLLDHFMLWSPDYEIGHVEPDPGQPASDGQLRLLMMAGRRAADVAEGRSGLLTGWHDRSRGYRGDDGDGPVGTLLSLGVCEMAGVIKGERYAFFEILDAIRGPAQVVFVPDNPIVNNSVMVAEQIRRTPAEREAIGRDLAEGMAASKVTPTPADWMFAGSMLNALCHSPATERYTVLGRNGLREAGPPDAIVFSLNGEAAMMLRHRRLGYALHVHDFRLADAGQAFLPWIRANFEPYRRSLDDVQADLTAMIDLIRADAPATQFLVSNVMSTTGEEDIQTYAPFDAPLDTSISSAHAKALNLMLHDLARERDIAIIDADAIAAELGGQRSLPDGVHQNGEMQAELRAEILRILRARGVPGFAANAP
jgi:hypothetical protein